MYGKKTFKRAKMLTLPISFWQAREYVKPAHILEFDRLCRRFEPVVTTGISGLGMFSGRRVYLHQSLSADPQRMLMVYLHEVAHGLLLSAWHCRWPDPDDWGHLHDTAFFHVAAHLYLKFADVPHCLINEAVGMDSRHWSPEERQQEEDRHINDLLTLDTKKIVRRVRVLFDARELLTMAVCGALHFYLPASILFSALTAGVTYVTYSK